MKHLLSYNEKKNTPINLNESDFIPGVSDSDYGLEANVVATKLGDENNLDVLYDTIINNKDVVSVISKLDNPDVVEMIEILKNNPEQLKRLTNTL
jgi:hypothetical protein